MVGLENKDFDLIYDKVVEELRGNLTNEEYRELITLEYVLTWGYGSPEDDKRFKVLRIKKHGV